MKNIVEIIYLKNEKFPKISINGEQISRYMELSDLIYDDMFNWASELFRSMDDELCEKYVIKLTGHPFHQQILQSLMGQSEYCEEVQFTPLQYSIPLSEKMAYAISLNQNYHLGIPMESDKVTFCSDTPEQFADVVLCSAEPSKYYITTGDQFPAECKYCVCVSDTVRFQRKHGVSYLNLPREQLGVLADYLNQYHITLGFLNAVFSAVADLTMEPIARLEYEAYAKEEYRVFAAPLPEKMETGEKLTVNYTYFPKCFPDPMVSCISSAPNVVFASGNTLAAGIAGSCTVTLKDSFNNEYGSSAVVVEEHNYVSNITIVLPATTMQINEKMHFQCILSPTNAEDANAVRYAVSDESVAVFTGPNELYALSAGRIRVTISTPRVSRNVYITVHPQACDVLLPEAQLTMPQNARADVCCSVVPANAVPMPVVTWTSSDPRVIRVSKIGSNFCTIVSKNSGNAQLICALAGTSIQKVMDITVEKPKGCYVATAVYGSYDCPQVWALRRYRDQFLATHWFGRAFISLYYAVSPTAVKLFGRTKWFNAAWRKILDRKVTKLKEKGYRDTPYND